MRRAWCAAALAWWLGAAGLRAGEPPADVPTTQSGGEEELSRREVNQQLTKLFDAGDHSGALALLDRALTQRPKDFVLHYNRACALAMLGRTQEAGEALMQSVSLGFVDFADMERDEHLAAIRGTSEYRAIVAGWRELVEARGESNEQAMREFFGTSYTFERDPGLRLMYASALEAGSFAAAQGEIRRVAEWAAAELWPERKPDPERPDPWVSVVLPTPRDFFGLVRAEGVGGIYDRDAKRLVAQDIGPTLRHEFLHVLHWRHQAQLGQRHPLWVMEGLAGLVEEMDEDGRMLASWRTNMAKRLERRGGLIKLSEFMRLSDERFMRPRPRATYAQARAVFLFLESQGKLGAWYRAYVAGFAEDASGVRAMETVLGSPIAEIERGLRAWLRELPEVAEASDPGEATLGAEMSPGAGDGPVVNSVHTVVREGGDPRGERLRRRDIVESIDGTPTRNLDDLARVLGEYAVGEEVTVAVRRGTRRLEIRIRLVPASEASKLAP